MGRRRKDTNTSSNTRVITIPLLGSSWAFGVRHSVCGSSRGREATSFSFFQSSGYLLFNLPVLNIQKVYNCCLYRRLIFCVLAAGRFCTFAEGCRLTSDRRRRYTQDHYKHCFPLNHDTSHWVGFLDSSYGQCLFISVGKLVAGLPQKNCVVGVESADSHVNLSRMLAGSQAALGLSL